MPHTEEKMSLLVPADCAPLIAALVRKLGGRVLEEEEEIIVIPSPPEHEWPGRRCKGLRCRVNLSQEELAAALDVPPEHIEQYENFTRAIPEEKIHDLARILGCSPTDLVCGSKNGA